MDTIWQQPRLEVQIAEHLDWSEAAPLQQSPQ
jgi:hypothetical protein